MPHLDFSKRSSACELMDAADVDRDDLMHCLVDLAAVNRVTWGYRPTLAFLERLRRTKRPTRPLRILDVACGSGDTLGAVARWAKRTGTPVDLTGLDISAVAIDAARRAWTHEQRVSWTTTDVLSYQPAENFDVVLSSLFAHHLREPQLVEFLRWMERIARLGWFVNDLHRHPVPYHSFRVLSCLYGWHHFVRHDGPVSIARAFKREDWTRLLSAAQIGTEQVRIRWWTPFRLCVEYLSATA